MYGYRQSKIIHFYLNAQYIIVIYDFQNELASNITISKIKYLKTINLK